MPNPQPTRPGLHSRPQVLNWSGSDPPTEFHIWPFGIVETSKGDFLFDELAAHSVLTTWREQGLELSLDYGHAAYHGGDAPAAGWFNLELREDGLWAVDVQWSPKADKHLRNREYRYISPWFNYDEESSRILDLVNIALTNTPATFNLRPLVAGRSAPEEENKMEPNTLAATLGLSQGTPEPQVLAEVLALRSFGSAMQELTGTQDRDSAMGVITAWREGAAQTEQLSRRVQELETAAENAEREDLIQQALTDRKLTPAQAAEGAFARTAPLATLKAYLSTAPRIVQAANAEQPAAASAALSWNDMDGPARAHLFQTNPDLYRELRQQALGR